jgi:predicted kinase
MATLIFVSGEAAVGKTTFIRRKYSDLSQYFFLNLHDYTHHFALHQDEYAGLAAALTQMHQEAVEALMDEKSLIIELRGTGMHQEVLELLEKAKKANILTEWIQLSLPEDERRKRMEKATKEKNYHSCDLYSWENLKVLEDILDNVGQEDEGVWLVLGLW